MSRMLQCNKCIWWDRCNCVGKILYSHRVNAPVFRLFRVKRWYTFTFMDILILNSDFSSMVQILIS
jgi:hypothetical protein